MPGGQGNTAMMAIRAFRVGRVLRLLNGAKDLKRLFKTLLLMMPGVANILGLMVLLTMIYAAVGMQMFSRIALNGDLNVHCNFRTFGNAMMSLFRFSTGENFNGFMHDLSYAGAGCMDDGAFDAALEDLAWARAACGFSGGYKWQDNSVAFPDNAHLAAPDDFCQPLQGCG